VNEDGVRLTSCFPERQRVGGGHPGQDLIGLFDRRNVAAGILLRAGHASGRPQDPVLTAIAVDARPAAEALLGQVLGSSRPRLVTLARTRLLRGDIAPVRLGEETGEATRLTVFLGSGDHVYLVPAFEAACELLSRRGIVGAIVLPGVDGTVHGQRQRSRLLRHDAGLPLMLVAVDAGDRIAAVLPELGMLFRHPVITVEKVQQCKRDGELIGRPRLADAPDGPPGAAAWLTLTVHTFEAAGHGGQPTDLAMVDALRSAGFSGTTTLRGTWGFDANQVPHADHFPHRGRRVPAVTSLTGPAEQVGAAFDVIDPLTGAGSLVTAETVLAVEATVAPGRPPH
jgi:PII-like signaling protein